MAELVYTRVSTDEQSTDRQTHLLAEAGLVDGAEGARLFADPATSSKIPALDRDGFRRLAGYARDGDRLTVSELYRLCRDLADILAVRDWCRQHGVKLRVLSGGTVVHHRPGRHRRDHHHARQRPHLRRPIPARPAKRTHL
ncbi:recombinase family protein [Nocardia cyriacigeorgica]|uniref:recombinase family protein n=1 Tax=Nocardia cyriacigeorgica TaxID=135487 RepID=UPI0018944A1D|nr:recombinase family protein [Nocardia cyriacigeorgica]MBF6098691.1 recombinase family protein [Nocardia cyriacigeorgica]MBF6162445.1 recombinase family protein [Nocardia cyriacigeorgica]MBF6201404.1 recombinase family protein [Nocardia cyriacigeorgica]MBF6317499.1 recombinase family protein [Nocardia cyriacigeorgica]MBF6514479.1 recombinase family protein [Nocardia cyriacigeorgica]